MRSFVAAIVALTVTAVTALSGAVLAAPAFASATAYTWIGADPELAHPGDGHSWGDAANWTPQGVPGDGDSVSIAEPSSNCSAHVDGIPAVTLANLAVGATKCGTTLVGQGIVVTGTFDWNGGEIDTPLTLDGQGTITGTNSHLNVLHADLSVAGALTLTGLVDSGASNKGGLRIDDPHMLTVGAGATLTSQGDNAVQYLDCCGAPARIVDAGNVVLANGSLTLHGIGYDASGATKIPAGRTLLVDGGPGTLTGTTIGGGGTFATTGHVTAGGITTLGNATTFALRYPGGSLDGNAVIGGAGRVAWSGGIVSGHLTLRPSGGVVVSGADPKAISNIAGGVTPSTLRVESPLTFTAGTADHLNLLDLGQSTMTVTSTTTLHAYDSIPSGTLVNTGHLVIRPGAGRSASRGGVMTTNRGTVTVANGTWNLATYRQTAGTTSIAAHATVRLPFPSTVITVQQGSFAGSGTLAGTLLNTGGTVRPGGSARGTLHIAGGYTQGVRATLALDLARAAHDVLAVAGSVSLRGLITAHTTGARPSIGIRDTVVKGAIGRYHVGCVRTSGTGSRHAHWKARHTSTAVRLTLARGAHRHC